MAQQCTEERPKKILVVGWDGADWRVINPLLERGELPNLERLIGAGIMGNLATLQPTLSPMIWTSIATGKMPDRHGIHGFMEVDEETGEIRPSTSVTRKVKAVWNILSQEGYRTHAINWFCSHPAEPINGVCVSEVLPRQAVNRSRGDDTLRSGTVHPDELSDILADFRVSPAEIDAETISLFVPRFREIDQDHDHRLISIAKVLAQTLTVHAAATWAMEHRPWEFMGVYYSAIDHFCHGFMKYHPPRMPNINKVEYEYYNDVVNSAYRLQDLLLGRMMQLADDDTTIIICSDHGFHIGDQRPRQLAPLPASPAEEHRPVGIFAMAGPGIKQDQLIHGASVLDITPTILTMLGLPVGQDMDGRPLLEAFENPPETVETIPSWEDVDGADGMHPPGTRVEPRQQRALMEQFAALGYIEGDDGRDPTEMAELTNVESNWNLARVHMRARNYLKALTILEDIYDRNPLRLDFGLALAECQFRLGLTAEAADIVSRIASVYPGQIRARLLLGLAEYYRGEHETALEHLDQVARMKPRLPALFVQLGTIYAHLRRPRKALDAFNRALAIDPDTAAAQLGIAKCWLRLREFEKAADAALTTLGLDFSASEAHFVLGLALARLGESERAIEALETCLRFAPGRMIAHRVLALLYSKQQGGTETAIRHQAMFSEKKATRANRAERIERVRDEARARAEARDRRRAEEAERLMADLTTGEVPETGTVAAGAALEPGSSGREFLIVSGLPRSGTSLMMQMLAEGGVPIMTDEKRQADENNPEGYYEWEGAKRLLSEPSLIEETEGKAVKVLSLLLARLPREHRYKIIFMRRPAEEIVRSQFRMLDRLDLKSPVADRKKLTQLARRHQESAIKLLGEVGIVDVLALDYPDVIANPGHSAAQIARFLGPDWLKTPERMASVIKPELYRERSDQLEQAAQ